MYYRRRVFLAVLERARGRMDKIRFMQIPEGFVEACLVEKHSFFCNNGSYIRKAGKSGHEKATLIVDFPR